MFALSPTKALPISIFTRQYYGLLFVFLFNSHSIEQGGLKDREIKSLRRQLDSRDDELAEMTRGREVALKENRRLQTDLNTMTEEHQVREKLIVILQTTEVVANKQNVNIFLAFFQNSFYPILFDNEHKIDNKRDAVALFTALLTFPLFSSQFTNSCKRLLKNKKV